MWLASCTLLSAFALLASACAGRPVPAGRGDAPTAAGALAALQAPGTHALDPANRQDWPPAGWDHARASVYNLVPAGPGHALRVWDGSGWSPDIAQTLPLDAEQAAMALLFAVHDEVLGRWEGLFSLLGAQRYTGQAPLPLESP